MNTRQRIDAYRRQNGGADLTHRQRRRAAKRAGTDPEATVFRQFGMGYPGSRRLIFLREAADWSEVQA